MAGATTIPTPKSGAETAIDGGTASLLTLHPDIIQTHILSRLNCSALASLAAACSQLYAFSSQEDLWANVCRSTWPSTSSPRIRQVIRSFPHGSLSFFFDSITIPRIPSAPRINLDRTPQLIFAVDLYYRRQPILSRVVETETVSDGFRCSRFRVDILEAKDVVETAMIFPESEEACQELASELRLSWIVLDASGRRAMNLANHIIPVGVERRWREPEVKVIFKWLMEGGKVSWSAGALCKVLLRCVGVEGGGMEVRAGSWLEMEEIASGMMMNGRKSLVFLQRALEGKRETEEERRKRRMREREREEMMRRREGWVDMACRLLNCFIGVCLPCVDEETM